MDEITLNVDSNILLDHFRARNQQADKVLCLCLGDRGYFAEITFVAKAMLYATAHDYKLVLDSSEFLHRYDKGWEDYFLPFCENYDREIHGEPAMTARFGDASASRESRGEGLKNFRAILDFFQRNVEIGPYRFQRQFDTLRALGNAILRFSVRAEREIGALVASLGLPEQYAAVHVRRGDKVGDEDIFYAADLYMEELSSLETVDTLFIMSDDYTAVQEVQQWLGVRRPDVRSVTLCTPKHAGFDIWKLRAGENFFAHRAGDSQPLEFREFMFAETVQLLAEAHIASRSVQFISSAKSNIFRAVRMMHNHPASCIGLQG